MNRIIIPVSLVFALIIGGCLKDSISGVTIFGEIRDDSCESTIAEVKVVFLSVDGGGIDDLRIYARIDSAVTDESGKFEFTTKDSYHYLRTLMLLIVSQEQDTSFFKITENVNIAPVQICLRP